MPFDLPHISGGNIGGHHIPQQREHEANAFAEVNKAAVGIVYDSLVQALTDLTPRYNFGYLGGFGYRATPDRSVLDHPLESVRASHANMEAVSDAWVAFYEDLVQMLPPNLAARLLLENARPAESRNLSFAALDNLLKSTAMVLAGAEQSGRTASPESLEGARTTMNLLLPFLIYQGSLGLGIQAAKQAAAFLAEEGANFPNFDGFNNLIGQMQKAFLLMELVNKGLKDVQGGNLTPETRKAALKAALILSTLVEQTGRVSLGSDLQILRSNLIALEIVASALTLPNLALASLYIALTTGMMGIDSSTSALGIVGPNLSIALNRLAEDIALSILPRGEYAGAKMLSSFVTMSLITFIGISALAVSPGLGPLPTDDPKEAASARFFAFEIAASLLVSSGIIEGLYREIIASAGGDEQAQATGGIALASVAYLAIILSGALVGNRSAEYLVDGKRDFYGQGIGSLQDIAESANSRLSPEVGVALDQMLAAIESHDYNGLVDALSNFAESLGVSAEGLKDDLSALTKTFSGLVNVAGMANNDDSITTMINVV